MYSSIDGNRPFWTRTLPLKHGPVPDTTAQSGGALRSSNRDGPKSLWPRSGGDSIGLDRHSSSLNQGLLGR
ncbi:hypothetical protein V5799_017329 [Amblyomma americanum]|uniref:Uncharacterized protein n=1 Tax=Amblyomma americanum TaxID=6943 RepID=A0AAQ4F2F7_AMBAM